jgi:hypothetical protein
MFGTKHSPEEVAWAKEHINRYNGVISIKRITEDNLVQSYKAQFGKQIKPGGLYTWFRALANPEKYSSRVLKAKYRNGNKEMDICKVFEQSKYILYIFGDKLHSFEKSEDVREFVSKYPGNNPMFLFERKDLQIKKEVTVTIV